MPRMTGYRFLAESMRGYGVSHIFFVPAILKPALAEMEDMGTRRVMAHGEKAAAYMADGYARAARRPGVCMAQTIGASNLAAGLKDAYMACAPVIALTGGSTPRTKYRIIPLMMGRAVQGNVDDAVAWATSRIQQIYKKHNLA